MQAKVSERWYYVAKAHGIDKWTRLAGLAGRKRPIAMERRSASEYAG